MKPADNEKKNGVYQYISILFFILLIVAMFLVVSQHLYSIIRILLER